MSVMVAPTRALLGARDSGGLIPPPSLSTGFGTPGAYVYDASTARQIPAVSRAIQLYGGMMKQMEMDAYRAGLKLPRPMLLDSPDPSPLWPRSRFVMTSVEDYLLSGNTVSLVTSRGSDGWPLSVMYLPINWVYITWMAGDPNSVQYTYLGKVLDNDDVIHIARGIDRWYPVRGIGVVEENFPTLDRAAMEGEYERSALAGGAVPSVAVIAPQAVIPQDVADEAKQAWMSKFSGPVREPVILPNGTQVVPLAWSPSDTQLTEARKSTLTDIANMFNLDSYWLGSAVQGMTYKTAAPQYQQILRTSIEPVLVDFEQVWSQAWLPRGQKIQFDRNKLLSEDLPTTALALSQLVGAQIMTGEMAYEVLQGVPLTAIPYQAPPAPPAPVVPPADTGGTDAGSA